jgi:hypothetical protein
VKPKRQTKKRKPSELANTKNAPQGHESGVSQQPTDKTKWVKITVDDVLNTLSPEFRKAIEYREKALSCPDGETDKLTPEQREWREKYRAEKWPQYYALVSHWRKEGNEAKHTQAIKIIHELDRQASLLAQNTPHPFKVSYSSYLSSLADVSCRYLQSLAQRGNQNAIADLAKLTVEMVETLTDLLAGEEAKVGANAQFMRRYAASLPYWPMLQFRHAAANNHFPRVADLLELGKNCLINATDQANYSLQTPINRFVWRGLKHFDEVHWIIRNAESSNSQNQTWDEIRAAGENAQRVLELVAAGKYNINPEQQSNDLIEKALEPYVFAETDNHRFGIIHRDEIPIYKNSFKLDPLTKNNAQAWADTAIMPFVRRRVPDLRQVEELHYLKGKFGPQGKRYALLRKAVIQALKQLARKT